MDTTGQIVLARALRVPDLRIDLVEHRASATDAQAWLGLFHVPPGIVARYLCAHLGPHRIVFADGRAGDFMVTTVTDTPPDVTIRFQGLGPLG